MIKSNVLWLLNALGISTKKTNVTKSSKDIKWLNIQCPFAPYTHSGGVDNTPSFGISIHKNRHSYYRCFACGVRGKFSGLPTKLGKYRKKDYSKLRFEAETLEYESISKVSIPDWDKYKQRKYSHDTMNLRKKIVTVDYPIVGGHPYLRSRGIDIITSLRLGLRIDNYEKRILFPCYYEDCTLAGFTGRSILSEKHYSKKYPKTKDYHGLDKRNIFLGLKNIKNHDWILVEGTFDYANLVKHGYLGAKACLGTAVTDQKLQILLNRDKPVYFLFDRDKAGYSALFGIEDENGNWDVRNAWAWLLYKELPVFIVPYLESSDAMDPATLTKQELEEMLSKAWLFTGKIPDSYNHEQPTF